MARRTFYAIHITREEAGTGFEAYANGVRMREKDEKTVIGIVGEETLDKALKYGAVTPVKR